MPVLHRTFTDNDVLTGNVPFASIGITPTLDGYAIVSGVEYAVFYQYVFARFRVATVTVRTSVEDVDTFYNHALAKKWMRHDNISVAVIGRFNKKQSKKGREK